MNKTHTSLIAAFLTATLLGSSLLAIAPSSAAIPHLEVIPRVDTECALSAEERESRIQYTIAQMRILNREFQQLHDRHLRRINDEKWLLGGYAMADRSAIIGAVAAVISGGLVAAEAYFGAASIQIGASGLTFVAQTEAGTALVSLGDFIFPHFVARGAIAHIYVGSRLLMAGFDLSHFIWPPQDIEEKLIEADRRAREATRGRSYFHEEAMRFLRDPTYDPGPNLATRGLNRMPVDAPWVLDSIDRALAFRDEQEAEIRGNPDAWYAPLHDSILLEFFTRMEGRLAQLDVGVMQTEMFLRQMRMGYWFDLLRVLRADGAACSQ